MAGLTGVVKSRAREGDESDDCRVEESTPEPAALLLRAIERELRLVVVRFMLETHRVAGRKEGRNEGTKKGGKEEIRREGRIKEGRKIWMTGAQEGADEGQPRLISSLLHW